MIIYKDILTGDEIMSDVFDIKDSTCDGLWEVDLKNITVGGEDFQLEGANASAEGEDAGEGVESNTEQKLDIVVSFRLNNIPRPEKKTYQAEMKKYAKAVVAELKKAGKEEQATKFQKTAGDAMKKILGDWKDLDIYTGESMAEVAMWIMVNYREDGITPYALIWKYAVTEMKV